MLNLFSAGRSRETVPIFPLADRALPGLAAAAAHLRGALHGHGQGVPEGQAAPSACASSGKAQEVGVPAVPEPVGCLARIAECDMEELGILKVKAEGLERFRIVSTAGEPPGAHRGRDRAPRAGGGGGRRRRASRSARSSCGKVIAGIGAGRFARAVPVRRRELGELPAGRDPAAPERREAEAARAAPTRRCASPSCTASCASRS